MTPLHVGCCVSAHGFGHAARVMAVMEELSGLADIELTVVSLVPEWFFRSSYSGTLSLFPLQTDVGLVQKTPLEVDIPLTLTRLSNFYPVSQDTVHTLASIFSKCDLVVCDISPAGILAARKAKVPSVLVENFTWDWIYRGYSSFESELEPFISYLQEVNALADYRVQTMPVCNKVTGDLQVPPVARGFRESRDQIRRSLQVDGDTRMVLVSMGGVGIRTLPLEKMKKVENTVFVVSGYTGDMEQAPCMRFLAPDTSLFHPDLVAASDALIGKVGYSTLAEAYHADVPFGYVSRKDFRESDPLVTFIQKEMVGLEIDQQYFNQDQWVDMLPQLFALGKKGNSRQNGAIPCAHFLLSLIGSNVIQ